MKLLSRVVWSEGMYLAPHHFQTQSRYFEESIHFAASALWFKPYGLLLCEMDHEALQNGTVSVLHARGVFRDGLPFHIPGSDPPPDPREIGNAFSPARDSHVVMLAIPRPRVGGSFGFGPLGAGDSRFLSESRMIADENTGRDEKPVELGRKNFRLLLDAELPEEYEALPVARIRRSGSGRFLYDSTFVPPLLRIEASEHVMTLLRRLCEILDEKSRAIAAPARQRGQALADARSRDLGSFWLLHTLHSSLGGLRHRLLARKGHPEDLYGELVQLAGALSCFALDAHPRDLPLYDHENLGECFDALDQKIRAWVDLMVPSNCVSIALQPGEPYFWSAAVEPRYLERSRWILEIQSGAGEASVISQTPQIVKVCSERFVGELVRRAVPGMALTHLPVPPPAVPAKTEAQYFGISKAGPCWDHIVKTRQVGVYVPGELPEPRMELHIVLEG